MTKCHKGSPEPITGWFKRLTKTKKRERGKNLSTRKCGACSRELVEGQDRTGQGGAGRGKQIRAIGFLNLSRIDKFK